jgi:alanine racemase
MSHREVLNLGGALDLDLAHLPFESALNLAISRSWLEIDLDAIKTNISTIRQVSGRGVEILLPVKADGYGHGATDIAYEAAESGVNWFGVASLEEALALRRSGIRQRILLLTPVTGIELQLLVAGSITPVIADLEVARGLNDTAGREGVVFPVHIEVDTGMGRAGVSWKRAVSFIRDVASLPDLLVEGVFSHFSSADEEDLTFTNLQLERFKGLMSVVNQEISNPPIIHMSNSAAALRIKGAGLPMIRPGLFIYGISPLTSLENQPPVTPIPSMSCRSRVVFVKDVEKGEPIGYGRSFVAPANMRVATVAIGYRDGLDYRLSNRGHVLIRGKRCSIVGNICMDMLMVDTTSDMEVRPGDRVTILGQDGGENIRAEAIADLTRTIPYDIVTKLGSKIPRLFFRGVKPVKVSSCLGTWEVKGKDSDQRDR